MAGVEQRVFVITSTAELSLTGLHGIGWHYLNERWLDAMMPRNPLRHRAALNFVCVRFGICDACSPTSGAPVAEPGACIASANAGKMVTASLNFAAWPSWTFFLVADVTCRLATPIATPLLLRLRRGQAPTLSPKWRVRWHSGSSFAMSVPHAGPLQGDVMHSPNLIAQTVLRLAAQTNTEGNQLRHPRRNGTASRA